MLCLCGAVGHANEATRPRGSVPPLTTITRLDVPRCLGTWYEIAKFPNAFQKKCAADTRADYSLRPDGQLQVVNRCLQEKGDVADVVGAARQIGDKSSPRLEVRFAPAWLSFVPFVWGDYWVIDLDPAYQLAAVREPRRECPWVLSRTPNVDPAAYAGPLERLASQGFDIRRLQKTEQRP